jgi:predicted RNA-binding Zn ribbon-like protein
LLDDEEPVGGADLRRAVSVREALRALLVANNGEPVDPAAVDTLNRAVEAARTRPVFDRDGGSRFQTEAAGVPGALGRVLAGVFAAMAEGTWPRLKACRNDLCRWVFYDASKNRSGTWCAMAVCGNRIKTRAYRRRQTSEG